MEHCDGDRFYLRECLVAHPKWYGNLRGNQQRSSVAGAKRQRSSVCNNLLPIAYE